MENFFENFSESEILLQQIKDYLSISIANFESIGDNFRSTQIKMIAEKNNIEIHEWDREKMIPGFCYVYLPADGTCGYHAIAKKITGLNECFENYSGHTLRNNVANRIKKNKTLTTAEKNVLLVRIEINEARNIGNFYMEVEELIYIAKEYNKCFLICDTSMNPYQWNFISPNTFWIKKGDEIAEYDFTECQDIIYLHKTTDHYTLMEPIIPDIIKRFSNNRNLGIQFNVDGLDGHRLEYDQINNNFVNKIIFFNIMFDKIKKKSSNKNRLKNELIKKLLDELNHLIGRGRDEDSNVGIEYSATRNNEIIDYINICINNFDHFYNENIKSPEINVELLFNSLYLKNIFECLKNKKIKILLMKNKVNEYSFKINKNIKILLMKNKLNEYSGQINKNLKQIKESIKIFNLVLNISISVLQKETSEKDKYVSKFIIDLLEKHKITNKI